MKTVAFGEIMMRLSPPGFQRFGQARTFDVIYGGGESNVAVSLANFGLPAAFITRLPANDLGDACIAYLRQYGVGVDNIVRGGERLGIDFLEVGLDAVEPFAVGERLEETDVDDFKTGRGHDAARVGSDSREEMVSPFRMLDQSGHARFSRMM